MKQKATHSSMWQSILLVLLTGLILAILIIIRQAMGIPAENLIESSWLVLILIPLVVWLVASGRLVEFSAAGVSAKLNEAAEQSITSSAFGQSAIANIDSPMTPKGTMAPKGTKSELAKAIAQNPTFLILELKSDRYADSHIEHWLSELLYTGSFRYVAFIKPDKTLKAYVPAGALLFRLKEPWGHTGNASISDYIRDGIVPPIDGLRTDWLTLQTTNHEALTYLTRTGRNDVAIVDKEGKLTGLLRRSDVVDSYVSTIIQKT